MVYYPDPYDVSEIDSQALELLLMPYYDAFYGELAPAACREKLLDGMNSLIMGCMEDEFQQRIYERAEPWTPQELHDLYSQLQQEYGIDALYLVFEGEWVTIRHTFESPFYYISYAVSQVPALCLWQESLTDYQGAMEKYDRIIHRNPYDTFSGILEKETLPSPFEEETIKELCLLLEQQGGEYIFGSDEAA